MTYIKRHLENHLLYMATKYPVVTLTGPRQSGKSTIVRHTFPEKKYIFIYSDHCWWNRWAGSVYSHRVCRLDKNGHEIDCLIDNKNLLTPIEIKAGWTVASDYFKGLDYFLKIAGNEVSNPYVIFGGDNHQHRTKADVIPWNGLGKLSF